MSTFGDRKYTFNNISRVYDLESREWMAGVDEDKKQRVCTDLLEGIPQGKDPIAHAKRLYRGQGEQDPDRAILLFRCINRSRRAKRAEGDGLEERRAERDGSEEDCSVDDITNALEAMSLSDNKRMMDARVDDIMFGDDSGDASYGGGAIHQSGGAHAHDLATLLFLKRNLINKLVEAGPEYADRLVGWIDSQLAKLKDCVIDILGINPATFYHDITNYIGGLYNQGAIAFDSAFDSASDNAKSVQEWIMANKVHAFGLTAFVVRYHNNIVDAGHAVTSVLSAIFYALAVAGSSFQTAIGQLWQSDTGVALLLSLYYYDQNARVVNTAVIEAFKAGKDNVIAGSKNVMAAIQQFETHVNGIVDDYAKVKLNDNLIQMMSKLKESLAADDTANAEHLAELAVILNRTTQAQIELVETVNKTAKTRSQTARIAAAKATLDSVKDQLDVAKQAQIEALLAARTSEGTSTSKGGKSRSRKSHKKVSKSKRPKRSARSRKAKGAKRSHKK